MSLLKNSSFVLLGIIISNALAYTFHIYVGRHLGPEEYGLLGSLIALLTLLALPTGALSYTVTKFISNWAIKKEYKKIIKFRKSIQNKVILFGAILLFILILSREFITNYLNIESTSSATLLGFIVFIMLLLPINRGLLQGMKKFKRYSANTIFESAARLAAVIIFFNLGFRVNGALLAYGSAYLLAFLFVFLQVKELKLIKNNSSKDGESKQTFKAKKIWYFFLSVLVVNIIIHGIIDLPTIFIRHYASAEFTGFWNAALTLGKIPLFAASGISLVMFSEVAGQPNKLKRKELLKKSVLLTMLISISASIIFWFAPELLLNALYGSEFLGASKILSYVGLGIVVIALLQLFLNYKLANIKTT